MEVMSQSPHEQIPIARSSYRIKFPPSHTILDVRLNLTTSQIEKAYHLDLYNPAFSRKVAAASFEGTHSHQQVLQYQLSAEGVLMQGFFISGLH
jgi:hypothetical protein